MYLLAESVLSMGFPWAFPRYWLDTSQTPNSAGAGKRADLLIPPQIAKHCKRFLRFGFSLL